ncbi:GntR family transcriptional regulator [Peterkaempfera bronchialis]|uniref:GntR family transcriptional regulator n=1 Tax=Peterkaempfera bronchialis TaxID=2126346 RepID=A0A345SXH1_9ACTN|nr:GntR family transcriptional regulator [Peterkaempfera bronchialis]AXI78426.1 GntR family transcriptional regulator [Peterkaempfera bronchialis]
MHAGSGPTAVRRSSLREQIANALREEMMAGRLVAGHRFTVKEIADLYGVSATPAREALVDLTAQGLLRIEHHRGFAVPALTWEDFLDIIEARILLTDNVFRHLRRRASGIDGSRLPTVHRRAEAATRAARAGQLDVLVGCDRRFWQEVTGLLGNARIADYLDWLRVQSWMYAAPFLRGRSDLSRLCWDGHLDLVERIAERDGAGAQRTVVEYNRSLVELMARLSGRQLEAAARLPLLFDEPAAASAAAPADGCGARSQAVPGQHDPCRVPGR